MKENTSRRNFLKSVSAGAAAAMSMNASSYARVIGANSRISIAVIGCGRRGFQSHMPGAHQDAKSENIFTWKDENKFDCPDQVEATWIYPEGFMVSYTTGYGNSSGKSYRFYGSHGVMDMDGADGPTVSGEGASTRDKLVETIPVEPVETTEHFLNWLQCLRKPVPEGPAESSRWWSAAGPPDRRIRKVQRPGRGARGVAVITENGVNMKRRRRGRHDGSFSRHLRGGNKKSAIFRWFRCAPPPANVSRPSGTS